jgi:hypothetical protein
LLLGVDVPTSAAPGADPVSYARRAESVGIDFLSASDHPVLGYRSAAFSIAVYGHLFGAL